MRNTDLFWQDRKELQQKRPVRSTTPKSEIEASQMDIKSTHDTGSFKKELKTFLFRAAYPSFC